LEDDDDPDDIIVDDVELEADIIQVMTTYAVEKSDFEEGLNTYIDEIIDSDDDNENDNENDLEYYEYDDDGDENNEMEF
jgi:hypothetical protein